MRDNTASHTAPYVIAVILTWNDTEMTSRCIESIESGNYPAADIVVVDNGTNPPSCQMLKKRFPHIETVQLDRNYGFTGGCNRGIERALDMGADYVFLLNNDTIVHADAIQHLTDAMEQRPDAAMASAVLLRPGEEKRMDFHSGVIVPDCAYHSHLHEGELLTEEYRATVETGFAPACAVMFRPEALREVGLFDERLFTNWEDYDLCCRFLRKGYKLLTVGQAEVIHAHGQTTGHISPFITYFFTRNRLICLFRYGKPLGILRHSLHYMRTLYWQVRAYGFANWPAHKAFIRGIWDFLAGVRGEGGAPADRRDKRKA